MRGEPFTSCKLHCSDPLPLRIPDGSFLVTDAGSAYRVERVRGRTLHCTRWPHAEVPDDAMIIRWIWTRRDPPFS